MRHSARLWMVLVLALAATCVALLVQALLNTPTGDPITPLESATNDTRKSAAHQANDLTSERQQLPEPNAPPYATPNVTQVSPATIPETPFSFGLDYYEDLRVLRKSFDAQPVTMYAMPLCRISIKLILDEAGRYESVSYPAENPPRDQPADMHSFLYDGRRYTFHRDEFPVFNEMMELVGLGPSRWEPALPPDPYPFNKPWPDDVIEHLSALAERASATKR